MDELQISGKRYISARRAAKENGYHSDYIGQLIRGGKLKGQKVGRAWYVAEDSLAAYLGNEAPVTETEAAPIEAVAEVVEEVVVETPAPIVEEVTEETSHEVVEEEVAEEEVAEEAEQEVTETGSEQEYRIPIRTQDSGVPRSGGLTYVQDEVSLRVPIEKKSAAVHTMPAMVAAEQASLISERDIRPVRRNGGGVLALTIVGVVVLFAFAALSSATVFEATVETGQPASTGYSISW